MMDRLPRSIILVMTTLPLTDVKARLSELVDQVESQHERVILTRNGRPAALLISPDDLIALEETIDLLSDAEALIEIKEARRHVAEGNIVDAEELRAKYLRA